MLSLFSIPKPFEGESVRLQRNAIGSWRALDPEADILLLGDDAGVAECASEFGATHLAEVARTQWGTPRVDDMFARAERHARTEWVCYINADIILTRSFFNAAKRMAGFRQPLLMVSQRWDLDVAGTLDFSDPHWEAALTADVRAHGQLHSLSGIDFFLYRKGFWNQIPPFGVGRTMWDNWFLYSARARGAMVVDATPSVCIVHQNHGYGHHPAGWQGVWKGPEAERNLELAGGLSHYFTIEDATHTLTERGLHRDLRPGRIRRRWQTGPVLYPLLARIISVCSAMGRAVYAMRVRIAHWRGRIPRA
jgi:hypothetical protein